jgi:hypothetical protein
MVEAGLALKRGPRRQVMRNHRGCLMPHFWLTYRDANCLVGVVHHGKRR